MSALRVVRTDGSAVPNVRVTYRTPKGCRKHGFSNAQGYLHLPVGTESVRVEFNRRTIHDGPIEGPRLVVPDACF